jgi:hypothetical protein
VFPESFVQAEFWFFIRQQAQDSRLGPESRRDAAKALDALEKRASYVTCWLAEGKPEQDELPYYGDPAERHIYPTLQEALLAFLVHRAARKETPDTLEMWLRTVALVLVDVHRDPSLLHVIACDQTEDGKDVIQPLSHTMVVSDDWTCLSRDTFDCVLRLYRGRG